MPSPNISGLYKGLFFLLLVFISIEYFFGTISYTKASIFFNISKSHPDGTTHSLHRPLFHSFIKVQNRSDSSTIGYLMMVNNSSISSNNNSANSTNNLEEISPTEKLVNFTFSPTLVPHCPEVPPNLLGRVPVIKSPVPTLQQLERAFDWLKPGGHWYPDSCRIEKKVAIITPFRCRGEHLLLFLQHMHPFLKRQQLDYTIFVIEQDGEGPFNRALLMNVGFKEALKIRDFDCFIFHDIDLLPEDDRNLYTCPEQPRHMSVAVDKFRYRLPYKEIFGGVSAISKEHFQLLNGFSNSFWGWGGEDDDMANRIKHHHLFISRYPSNVARYTMLTHKKDKPSPNRYDVLMQGKKKYDKDGLNSLKYKVVQKKENLLYTWFLIGVKLPGS